MDELTKILLDWAKLPVGAVLGAVIKHLWDRRRERKTENNMCALLLVEVGENVAALRGFQETIRKKVESHALQAEHFQLMIRSDSFRTTALPEWRHQAFDKLFSSLSGSLNEEQVRGVSDFHRRLDKLTETHAKMYSQHPTHPPEETVKRAVEMYKKLTGEDSEAPTLDTGGWQPFEEEVTKLIDLGDQLQRRLQPTRPRLTAPIRKLLG